MQWSMKSHIKGGDHQSFASKRTRFVFGDILGCLCVVGAPTQLLCVLC